MSKILIVENDPSVMKLYETILQPLHQLLIVHSGEHLTKNLQNFLPDLLILDVELGADKNGFELAAEIQKQDVFKAVPVLFVTAQNSPNDLSRAFRSGGDDYIAKPFKPYELIERVELRIHKAQSGLGQARFIQLGTLKLDLINKVCLDGENLVDLTPTEFNILVLLAKNPGRTVDRKEISLQALGGKELSPTLIDSYMTSLKKKIPLIASQMESVYAVGFRLPA